MWVIIFMMARYSNARSYWVRVTSLFELLAALERTGNNSRKWSPQSFQLIKYKLKTKCHMVEVKNDIRWKESKYSNKLKGMTYQTTVKKMMTAEINQPMKAKYVPWSRWIWLGLCWSWSVAPHCPIDRLAHSHLHWSGSPAPGNLHYVKLESLTPRQREIKGLKWL